MSKNKYTFIDLFAGCGELHLALENLGRKGVFITMLACNKRTGQYVQSKLPKTLDVNHDIVFASDSVLQINR